MPQPYPGQQWTHGWKPLTPGAATKKNHGRKPGAGSLLARVVAEAAEVHNRMKAEDAKRDGKLKEKRTPAKPSNATPAIAYKVTGNDPVSKDRGSSSKQDKPGAKPTSKSTPKTSAKPDLSSRVDDAIRTMAGRPPKKNDRDTKTPEKATPRQPSKPNGDSKPAGGNSPATDADVEASVADFLNDLPEGRWTTMTKLREKLKGIPRDRQDDVIRQMMLDGKVDIERAAISNDLGPKDREAEIMIGSRPNHMIRRAR